jgi:hypothetical protein
MVHSKSLVRHLDPRDEGATVPRTVSDCLPFDTEQHSRIFESSIKESSSHKRDLRWLGRYLSLKYSTQGNMPNACDYGSTDLDLRSRKVKVQLYV